MKKYRSEIIFVLCLMVIVGVFVISMLLVMRHLGLLDRHTPAPSPTVAELQAEVARLAPYEEFMRSNTVTITYNGCEDLREGLGL